MSRQPNAFPANRSSPEKAPKASKRTRAALTAMLSQKADRIGRGQVSQPRSTCASAARVRHADGARVGESIAQDPVLRPDDAAVEEAGQTMSERGFRLMSVVAGEHAGGIVSIRDVAERRLKERTD